MFTEDLFIIGKNFNLYTCPKEEKESMHLSVSATETIVRPLETVSERVEVYKHIQAGKKQQCRTTASPLIRLLSKYLLSRCHVLSQAWKQSHAQDMRAPGSSGMNTPVVTGKGWRTMISQQISKQEILDETERTGALRESLSVDEVFEPRSEF